MQVSTSLFHKKDALEQILGDEGRTEEPDVLKSVGS